MKRMMPGFRTKSALTEEETADAKPRRSRVKRGLRGVAVVLVVVAVLRAVRARLKHRED